VKKVIILLIILLMFIPIASAKVFFMQKHSYNHENPYYYQYTYGGTNMQKMYYSSSYGSAGYIFYTGHVPKEYRRVMRSYN